MRTTEDKHRQNVLGSMIDLEDIAYKKQRGTQFLKTFHFHQAIRKWPVPIEVQVVVYQTRVQEITESEARHLFEESVAAKKRLATCAWTFGGA